MGTLTPLQEQADVPQHQLRRRQGNAITIYLRESMSNKIEKVFERQFIYLSPIFRPQSFLCIC